MTMRHTLRRSLYRWLAVGSVILLCLATNLTAASEASAAAVLTAPFSGTFTVPHKIVDRALLSPDGSVLYAQTYAKSKFGIALVSTATKQVVRTVTVPHQYSSLTVAPITGDLIGVAQLGALGQGPPYRYSLDTIDPRSSRVLQSVSLPAHFDPVTLRLSPDGAHAALVGSDAASTADFRLVEFVEVNLRSGAVSALLHEDLPSWSSDAVFSKDSSRVYLPLGIRTDSGRVDVIDTSAHIVTKIAVGSQPESVVLSIDGSNIFVANYGSSELRVPGSISIVDTASESLAATLPNPPNFTYGAQNIVLSADGSKLLVNGTAVVAVLDLATHRYTPVRLDQDDTLVDVQSPPVAIPHSSAFAYSTQDFKVGIIDARTASVVGYSPQPLKDDIVFSLAVTPDGSRAFYDSLLNTDPVHGGSDLFGVVDLTSIGWKTNVDRIAGVDRYATSVATSRTAYPKGAKTVYLASGATFPDATGAAAAAGNTNGPLLLTTADGVPAAVLSEVKRLHPTKVVVVGGSTAYGNAVKKRVATLHLGIVRRTGSDRYATARAILAGSVPTHGRTVFVATGQSYGAGTAGASAAAATHQPFLLVNGSATALDAATVAALKAVKPKSITVVGSTSLVSAGVAKSLAAVAPVTRVASSDPAAGAQRIADTIFPKMTTAYVASTGNFQDAIAGVTVAAASNAPLELSRSTCLPGDLEDDLAARRNTRLTLLGGTPSLSAGVARLSLC